MNNLTEVSEIDFYHNGWPPGFRTWTLKAFYNNKEICCVNNSESNNYLKYVKFIQELKKKEFKLRECDRVRLKSGEKGFMNSTFLKFANRGHLCEIASYAGYSKDDLDNMKNRNNDYQNEFAENTGLERNEFEKILKVW